MKKLRKKISALVMAAVMLFSFAGFMKAPEKAYAAVNPADIHTIEQVPLGWWAIQALVNLKTTPGTGSHAKILMKTPTAALSFGIQYDTMCQKPEYRGGPPRTGTTPRCTNRPNSTSTSTETMSARLRTMRSESRA